MIYRTRALLALLGVFAFATLAAQEPEIAINGRSDCDTALYHEPDIELAALIDTARALPLITTFKRPERDAFTIAITFAPSGQLDSLSVVADHSRREREALASSLRPLVPAVSPGQLPLGVHIDVTDNPVLALSISAASYTCMARSADPSSIGEAFARFLTDARTAGSLPSKASGKVTLAFTVTPDGRPADIRVHRASHYPAADSAAVHAIAGGAFLPAVAGRRYVKLATLQTLAF